MTGRFSGKSVMITGAASGLGAACASAFAEENASLLLVDINHQKLTEVASAIRASGIAVETVTGDVSSSKTASTAVDAAVKLFGQLDILFNNAGIDPLSATTVTGTTEEQWDNIMNINVKSAYLFSKAAIPVMIAAGGGAIISTSSVSAVLPSPAETAYSVSKAAMMHLNKCIARDYAKDRIRANCICPGFLESVMSDRRLDLSHEDVEMRTAAATALVPMGRQGRYSEIARSVLFLASDIDAAYITGATLVIDGGLTLT